MIGGLPDDWPVVECRDGNISTWTAEPEIFVGKVYKFLAMKSYGPNKGSMYEVEYSEVCNKDSEIVDSYDALIFETTE